MNAEVPDARVPAAGSPGGASVPPLDWARVAGAEEIVEREMHAGIRRRRQRRAAAFGVALIAVVVGGIAWRSREAAFVDRPAPAASFVSAPSRQVLPDGSVVELNGTARVTIAFSEKVRRVVLEQGEAHFQVAKNARRPFVVMARGVEVLAVGTAFSVEIDDGKIDVLVTEGRVAVAESADRARAVVPVDAGQKLSVPILTASAGVAIPAVAAVLAVEPAELAERMAWRIPRLELNATPLSEVLPVIRAHGGVRLELSDTSLGELKLSGSLRANNVPVLLRILETSYGVRTETRANGEIVLRRGR
jgi:transmembrane sensor